MAKIYKLRKSKYSYFLRRDGEVKCYNCGKEIMPGELVVSRGGTGVNRVKIYCIKCAVRLNLVEVPA